MMTNKGKYLRLAHAERVALKRKTSKDWQSFIAARIKGNDLRFLFLKEHFIKYLSELEFASAEWGACPWKVKNTPYDLSVHHHEEGVLWITGQWGKDIELENKLRGHIAPNREEQSLLQSLLEEFDVYEYIMKMDAYEWSDSPETETSLWE